MRRTIRPRRGTALTLALGVLVVLAFAIPSAAYSGPAATTSATASCQLQVFSWWTGGGEAAGLTKLINIWNKAHPNCPFKNETVAGGAGTNAKAVLAQRLAAHKPPDSFQGHAGAELRDYIKAGQVLPIDFIYRQYHFDKIMPSQLINQIKYNGHLYSVPVNIHRANILWYNPKVLKRAGIAKVPLSWNQFIAALTKAKNAGVIPLAMGEQWTAKHLLETVIISTIGPARWATLWKKSGNWNNPGITLALNRYKTLLSFTNSDAASLTWQDAGKLVADGKAAFNIMGDWQDGYFSGTKAGGNLALKPNTDYGWTAVPGSNGVYDWLSDSFTLPKGAPHRAPAVQWLAFLGSKKAQDTFNPVKGSIPARQDANAKLYGPYLQWALKQWKSDSLAGSLTHGVVAPNNWNADIDTALGLFLATKDVKSFQSALVKAHNKFAT
ncbi:MAG TPA: ABC transporter substrate-binding protein [Gaiellaceae bacterium]|nr:ABC transporter substrate-binding protein [Gaiellaceae bacterium]